MTDIAKGDLKNQRPGLTNLCSQMPAPRSVAPYQECAT